MSRSAGKKGPTRSWDASARPRATTGAGISLRRRTSPARRRTGECPGRRVGGVRESKGNGCRVSVVRAAVRGLVGAGQTVLVQGGAGRGSGIDRPAYQAAGGVIVPDAAAIFRRADLIVKVKEPQESE